MSGWNHTGCHETTVPCRPVVRRFVTLNRSQLRDFTWLMIICTVSFVMTLLAVNLFAATAVVKPGESINARLKDLQPGDTLLVRAGTYTEAISLPRDGQPGKRIVLQAWPGEKPVIATSATMLSLNRSWWLIRGLVFDHQGAESDAIKISGSNNILRGCEIRNGKRDGIDGSGSSANITIENCVIHDFVWEPGSDAHGIVVSPGARGWKILRNTIYNCGGDCLQIYAGDDTEVGNYAKDFTISGNVFYTKLGSNSENALDFKGIDGCLVDGNELYGFENKAWVVQKGCRNLTGSNNIIHDSERGMEFRGEGGKTQENIRLHRNVLYNIRDYYAIKFDGVANAEVLHNTLANITPSSFRVEGLGVTGGVFRNNLIYNSGSASISGTFDAQCDHNGWFKANAGKMSGTGDVSGDDPKFQNPAQNNFRLLAGSPARDAGVEVGLPFTGEKPDLGAFEYGATTPVQLNSFSVEPLGLGARLRWHTGAASEFSGFEVQRSNDGAGYAPVTFVPAADPETTIYEYADRDLAAGHYWYRLKLLDLDGQFTYSGTAEIVLAFPSQYALWQNYPNPFAAGAHAPAIGGTHLSFDLQQPAWVELTIFNLLGQTVRSLAGYALPAGRHQVSWDGRREDGAAAAAGTYVYRLVASRDGAVVWSASRSMIVVR